MMQVLSILLFLIIATAVATGSVPDFDSLVSELRGDDVRLFRWDATDHTSEKQNDEKLCGRALIQEALTFLVTQKSEVPYDHELQAKALEYISLCITDNPTNRAIFASYPGIHDAIIGLIGKSLSIIEPSNEESFVPPALWKLAHVIYITTFANADNHQAYINKGAVRLLGQSIKTVVKREIVDGREQLEVDSPIVIMWSAAALANLAASYCNTEDDGRCYWSWNDTGLEITKEFGSMNSDGSAAREIMLEDDDLVQLLVELACMGYATDEEEDIMVGENAEIDRDEDSVAIVPWAAASALNNLALHMDSHATYLEPSLSCFCHLSQSVDWLEAQKALQLLERARRGYPCFFRKTFHSDGEYAGDSLCLDDKFFHEDGYTCTDFDPDEPPSDEDCAEVDRNGVAAASACCVCQGGSVVEDPVAHEPRSDEEL